MKKDTETIAREFVTNIITQFGVPKKPLTDRGANFTSALIKETCRLLKIQKLKTSSIHLQGNGICERMNKLLIDMLSHFVRKDARNWDEYVPYAVMAYRAMPHCSTKYSPYYLVFGRDMRLPIEDDWIPNLGERDMKQDEYETHVKLLVERLRVANQVAGRQSKLSHETAQRYYDRQTKPERFIKGDFVYVHDPIYKRGKAKKFSYQYKGQFEVEQRISPLIYKVRMADGSSAILHVNRLKRAYEQIRSDKVVPPSKDASQVIRQERKKVPGDASQVIRQERKKVPGDASQVIRQERKKVLGDASQVIRQGRRKVPEENMEAELEELEEDVSPHTDRLEIGSEESDESDEKIVSSPRKHRGDPEWTPGSSYLQRKLKSNSTADDVAYRLRSRLVNSSGRETETDKEQTAANSLAGSEPISTNTRESASSGRSKFAASNSYNFRSRVESTINEQRNSN
jgi:transposase InsO family protein